MSADALTWEELQRTHTINIYNVYHPDNKRYSMIAKLIRDIEIEFYRVVDAKHSSHKWTRTEIKSTLVNAINTVLSETLTQYELEHGLKDTAREYEEGK